jgi:hypothetical protein
MSRPSDHIRLVARRYDHLFDLHLLPPHRLGDLVLAPIFPWQFEEEEKEDEPVHDLAHHLSLEVPILVHRSERIIPSDRDDHRRREDDEKEYDVDQGDCESIKVSRPGIGCGAVGKRVGRWGEVAEKAGRFGRIGHGVFYRKEGSSYVVVKLDYLGSDQWRTDVTLRENLFDPDYELFSWLR